SRARGYGRQDRGGVVGRPGGRGDRPAAEADPGAGEEDRRAHQAVVTLAQALEPLYRGYLRRLDEMVARLPEGAALTERTTRTEDGRLVLGDEGLPLRFDVADARDGHTYEVHGAHPDEPLAPELREGGVVV